MSSDKGKAGAERKCNQKNTLESKAIIVYSFPDYNDVLDIILTSNYWAV